MPFLYWITFALLLKISWLYLCGTISGIFILFCSISLFVCSFTSTTLSYFSKSFFFFNFIYLFIFGCVLGLRFCAWAFSSCGERGPLFITVRRPLTVTASLVAEHKLQTCRLSSRGSRAQLLCGMWDPPRSGLEPVSPALAGRLSTTVPPGKPCSKSWTWIMSILQLCSPSLLS